MSPKSSSILPNFALVDKNTSSWDNRCMDFFHKIWVFLIDTVQTFFVAIAIFLFIYIFLFRPFEVNGASMYPNFKDTEYVLTNLIVLRFDTLKHGDVVVFKAPVDPDKDFIKRVIGVPGDSVELKN